MLIVAAPACCAQRRDQHRRLSVQRRGHRRHLLRRSLEVAQQRRVDIVDKDLVDVRQTVDCINIVSENVSNVGTRE